jgi:hypothetical protein
VQVLPDFFHWTWTGLGALAIFLIVWMILFLTKRNPEMASVRIFMDMFSDRGPIIVILGAMSIYFFVSSMRLFYVAVDLMVQQKLDAQNAIVLMGIQFATGSAFGGAFGAMLTTMKANAPPPDNIATTTTSSSSKEPATGSVTANVQVTHTEEPKP